MRFLIFTLAAVTAIATTAHAQEMSSMDANEDGVLSVAEFVAGHDGVDPSVFAAVDANEDGLIDPAEYMTATAPGGPLSKE